MIKDKIHVSIDLETMSTAHNAAIIQIGACTVDLHNNFEVRIDPPDAEIYGDVSPETMQWWDKQNLDLKNYLFSGTTKLKAALGEFANWCEVISGGDLDKIVLWARNPEFDLTILRSAYETHREYPFNFRNRGCQRTVEMLLDTEDVKAAHTLFEAKYDYAEKHDAIMDAIKQAHVLQLVLTE